MKIKFKTIAIFCLLLTMPPVLATFKDRFWSERFELTDGSVVEHHPNTVILIHSKPELTVYNIELRSDMNRTEFINALRRTGIYSG